METALCSTCKRLLPISEFYKDSGRKNGLYSRCKECVHARDMSERGRYNSYIRNARHRGIPFELSFEDFKEIASKCCVYCGSEASPMNGIDRRDNSVGYIKGNCAPCCKWCNQMKLTHSEEEFREQIAKIYRFMWEGKPPNMKGDHIS